MRPSPVVAFLEEFASATSSLPAWPDSGSDADTDGALELLAGGDMRGAAPAPAAGDEPAPQTASDHLEVRLAAAREEGYRKAQAELEGRQREALAALEAGLRAQADAARKAEIDALRAAVDSLFRQYESWLDRFLTSGLHPVVRHGLHRSALETFKAQLLEGAAVRGMAVNLSGPAELVAEMAAMLEPHGLDLRLENVEGERELCARLDNGLIRTRLATVRELLAEPAFGAGDRRDD